MSSLQSPAENLPELYRAVLDGVDLLERQGARSEAASIRQAAIRAYSTAWDDAQRRRLEQLVARCRHRAEHTDRPRLSAPRVPRIRLRRWANVLTSRP